MSADDDNVPPFDIQIEIIKRLPIKSLIKFRSVSKPWRSIIHSSDFIADYNIIHTHHHNPNPQQLLVSVYDQNYVYIIDDNDDDDDDDSFPQHNFRLTLPGSVKPSGCYPNNMIGYSQGLFCFYNYYVYPSVAVIWNPSIRKSVDIPVPNVLQLSYDTVFGFGVRNATDPIIVKIINVPNNKLGSIPSQQVEVFTLSTGVWRSLSNSHSLPRISIALTRKVVVIDKFIFWLCLDNNRALILSFDATSEEFKEIYLPPILANTRCANLELSKLRGSLVVLHIIYREEENKLMHDVWMREDGVQNSFKKLYTVKEPDTSRRQFVLGFRNNGQPIIERYDHNNETRLFVYEPDLECFNDIGRHSFSCFAGSYMETLLLLDH